MGKKKKGSEKKGKKPHRNKLTSKKYKFYTIEGDTVKRKPHCPRCGVGVFLANGGDRMHCGKCHYTEFKEKVAKVETEKRNEDADIKEKSEKI